MSTTKIKKKKEEKLHASISWGGDGKVMIPLLPLKFNALQMWGDASIIVVVKTPKQQHFAVQPDNPTIKKGLNAGF